MSASDPHPTEPERTGLIIIRLWQAGTDGDGIRATLTIKLDVAADPTDHAAASSVDALCSQVRSWAEAFLGQPP